MIKAQKIKKGFSLFELSIVIAIIGFLAFGVIKGEELIRKSKTASAASLTKSSIVGKMDNLVLWLETTMPNSFKNNEEVDGGSIETWFDISNAKTTAFNATQPSAKKPIYTANIINGLPALKFTRSVGTYISVTNDFDNNTETATIFLVWQPTSVAGQMDLLSWDSTPYSYLLTSLTTYKLMASDATNTPTVTSTTSRISGVPQIISARKIKNGAMNLWVNGTAEGGTITDNTTSGANSSDLSIGCVGANCTDGYIGEIIIFDKALSDQEINDVETYLGKKWAITIS